MLKASPGPHQIAHQMPNELNTDFANQGGGGEFQTRSSNEVKNYEVSRTISTTLKPSNMITAINASVLVRDPEVENPETGLKEIQKITPEKLAEIEALVVSAIGINAERGDKLTVKQFCVCFSNRGR